MGYGDREQSTGKSLGTDKDVAFGSGELDNGTTFTVFLQQSTQGDLTSGG